MDVPDPIRIAVRIFLFEQHGTTLRKLQHISGLESKNQYTKGSSETRLGL